MIEVFKILHKKYDSAVTDGILHRSHNTTTRGHPLKLSMPSSRLDIRRNSFGVRVVKPWNSLPEEVVLSESVKIFESRLDKFWSNQPTKYDFKQELHF